MPLVENVWWLDLDFLSLTLFSSGMWDEILECDAVSCPAVYAPGGEHLVV